MLLFQVKSTVELSSSDPGAPANEPPSSVVFQRSGTLVVCSTAGASHNDSWDLTDQNANSQWSRTAPAVIRNRRLTPLDEERPFSPFFEHTPRIRIRLGYNCKSNVTRDLRSPSVYILSVAFFKKPSATARARLVVEYARHLTTPERSSDSLLNPGTVQGPERQPSVETA